MSEKITDRQKNYTLFVLVLVFTSSHVDRQIMGILGQPIKESLQISDTQLGLLTGIMFAVFYATLGMPMAMWADRRNRRNLISFSVFLWSGMTALCGAAANFTQLLLLRIGVGVGEAGSNPPSHSIIADLYPKEQRATAMAVVGMAMAMGVRLRGAISGRIDARRRSIGAEWGPTCIAPSLDPRLRYGGSCSQRHFPLSLPPV